MEESDSDEPLEQENGTEPALIESSTTIEVDEQSQQSIEVDEQSQQSIDEEENDNSGEIVDGGREDFDSVGAEDSEIIDEE